MQRKSHLYFRAAGLASYLDDLFGDGLLDLPLLALKFKLFKIHFKENLFSSTYLTLGGGEILLLLALRLVCLLITTSGDDETFLDLLLAFLSTGLGLLSVSLLEDEDS